MSILNLNISSDSKSLGANASRMPTELMDKTNNDGLGSVFHRLFNNNLNIEILESNKGKPLPLSDFSEQSGQEFAEKISIEQLALALNQILESNMNEGDTELDRYGAGIDDFYSELNSKLEAMLKKELALLENGVNQGQSDSQALIANNVFSLQGETGAQPTENAAAFSVMANHQMTDGETEGLIKLSGEMQGENDNTLFLQSFPEAVQIAQTLLNKYGNLDKDGEYISQIATNNESENTNSSELDRLVDNLKALQLAVTQLSSETATGSTSFTAENSYEKSNSSLLHGDLQAPLLGGGADDISEQIHQKLSSLIAFFEKGSTNQSVAGHLSTAVSGFNQQKQSVNLSELLSIEEQRLNLQKDIASNPLNQLQQQEQLQVQQQLVGADAKNSLGNAPDFGNKKGDINLNNFATAVIAEGEVKDKVTALDELSRITSSAKAVKESLMSQQPSSENFQRAIQSQLVQQDTYVKTSHNNMQSTPASADSSSAQIMADKTVQSLLINSHITNPGWGKQFAQQVMWMRQQQLNLAEIRLNPVNLGPVKVSISQSESDASIQIWANQAQTREMLEQALPKLKEMLAESGVESFNVEVEDFEQAPQQFAEQNESQSKTVVNNVAPETSVEIPQSQMSDSDQILDLYA